MRWVGARAAAEVVVMRERREREGARCMVGVWDGVGVLLGGWNGMEGIDWQRLGPRILYIHLPRFSTIRMYTQ